MFTEIRNTAPPHAAQRITERAVVLGGSIAGLLAARVLADHVDEVLVVERDDTASLHHRRGVPQAQQFHGLLSAGHLLLERWFPGLTDTLAADGAVLREPDQVRHYIDGVRLLNVSLATSGPAPVATRPVLEKAIRDRVVGLAAVRVVRGQASGLLTRSGRVTGVQYVVPGSDETVDVTAGLVVDATGRASRAPEWLAEHGITAPSLRRIPIKVNYATARYHRDPAITSARVVLSQSRQRLGTPRLGAIGAVENRCWQVTLAGYDTDRPSRDRADFAARCRQDFPSEFGLIVDRAEPMSEVATYHLADSRRRDYHTIAAPPAGFVAVGDAMASYNPVYGQGMTSAALHAVCLSRFLQERPRLDEPARGYLDRAGVVVDAAWEVATTADLALPHVDRPWSPGYRVRARIAGWTLAAATCDPVVSQRLSSVTSMLAHPSELARPSNLARVAAVNLSRADRTRAAAGLCGLSGRPRHEGPL